MIHTTTDTITRVVKSVHSAGNHESEIIDLRPRARYSHRVMLCGCIWVLLNKKYDLYNSYAPCEGTTGSHESREAPPPSTSPPFCHNHYIWPINKCQSCHRQMERYRRVTGGSWEEGGEPGEYPEAEPGKSDRQVDSGRQVDSDRQEDSDRQVDSDRQEDSDRQVDRSTGIVDRRTDAMFSEHFSVWQVWRTEGQRWARDVHHREKGEEEEKEEEEEQEEDDPGGEKCLSHQKFVDIIKLNYFVLNQSDNLCCQRGGNKIRNKIK